MDIIVPPHRYNRAFDEIRETIRYGLDRLATTGFALPERTIVIGGHLLPPTTHVDKRRILYNFEQPDSPQLNATMLNFFAQHEVWSYSPATVTWLAEHGVRAKYVPIGWVPELSRIQHAPTPDIDVLHYGLINDRRRRILEGLRTAGVIVRELSECYGNERDAWIARSKLVLNVHFHDARVFEIARCSYLFANTICVVSEDSVDVPPELAHAAVFASYEQIVDTCVRLVSKPEARIARAQLGHRLFTGCSEVEYLKEALGPHTG